MSVQLLIDQRCWQGLFSFNSLQPGLAPQLAAPFGQLPLGRERQRGWRLCGASLGCILPGKTLPKTSCFTEAQRPWDCLPERVVSALMKTDLNADKARSLAV